MTDGRISIEQLTGWLLEFARLVTEHRDELTTLDAAIGDADHGTNMERGMSAVVLGLGGDTVGALCKQAGMTLVSTVGGASGPLYGTFLLRFGSSAGDVTELSAAQFAAAMRAGLDGIVARGKAEREDKTMFDALAPAVEALEAGAGGSLVEALRAAAEAADKGRDATVEMLARKGRASYLGERSVGHQDPGATSAALLVGAAATTLA
ncbi:MAG: phosphoenolpyruvate---glycerone phosphotransferase subunit DhaL [Pseudonocardiales bacterium]|jgi:dihydroxyacetone kinase-like protein|nr:phosphoenolpyruvate---glycerone phosphotransferase subunit DhaL [Pseudonocardiales bacterium]MDT4944749.1 phosphoenolpyruvate---glycerone phosphotransferase subunit DhaL [Pseudonocardiales bacterium]